MAERKKEIVYLAFRDGSAFLGAFQDFGAAFAFLKKEKPGYFEEGHTYTSDEVAALWQWDHPTMPTYLQIMREPVH